MNEPKRDQGVLLITGASSGIGAETARAASADGYRVALAARTEERLRMLADEFGGTERAFACRCDVTNWDHQERLVARVLDRFGRLDAVFANAGHGTVEQGFDKGTPEDWRQMVLTNVLGTAYTIRASIPALTEQQGHLILMGSLAGRRVLPGSVYSCTKFAVVAMGESARQDLHGTGVRVTVIEPGLVATPFFQEPPEDVLDAKDVAAAVLFALAQPPHVNVNEIALRPISQEN